MAKQKRPRAKVGTKHAKKPPAKVTRRSLKKGEGRKSAGTKKPALYRKLDLKKRALGLRVWQSKMEAARLECIRLGIGAVKYLSDKNDIRQLPDCPLTMTDKTRLAHNLRIGRIPRLGKHMQHLTDAEEHDVSVVMVKAAHERNPSTWRSMEEAVAETITNRANGPEGRAFTQPSKQRAVCARKGGAGFKWRHSFIRRVGELGVGMKDFAAEDLGQSRARACNERALD